MRELRQLHNRLRTRRQEQSHRKLLIPGGKVRRRGPTSCMRSTSVSRLRTAAMRCSSATRDAVEGGRVPYQSGHPGLHIKDDLLEVSVDERLANVLRYKRTYRVIPSYIERDLMRTTAPTLRRATASSRAELAAGWPDKAFSSSKRGVIECHEIGPQRLSYCQAGVE
jgi:hypothetical protein